MQVHLSNYPYGGARFTDYTLSKMRDMVGEFQRHPSVVKIARDLTRGCGYKDYAREAEELFNWFKANIRYVRDPHNTEWVQSPLVTIREAASDCDCGAVALASLFSSLGMPSGFEAIKADRAHPEEFSHVYAIVKTPKGWRAADWTVSESYFGWRPTKGVLERKVVLNP
jgi:transglutaminase-like putative cysteine protease